MRKIILTVILLATTGFYAQVGIGTTNPEGVLDVVSTNSGVVLPRVANTAAVTIPVNGMVIYDLSSHCLRLYANGVWSPCFAGGLSPTSGGTGLVSAYSCSTASAGTMTAGTPVSGVTQTITATVTTVGSYSISTTANGVTFAASGTFAGTGAQNIVLTATGTPTAAGTNTFTLNTTPGCSFNRTTNASTPTITSTTGKIWMDKNLGATQVATSATDHLAYGDLYQWGRKADGHELITWTSGTAGTPVNGTTSTNANIPANNLFIIETNSPNDWRVNQDDNLWNGLAAVNNPCPAGFRVPTSAELTAEVVAYSITNSATAFSSPFKFTVPGFRNSSTGALSNVGSDGVYWSSSVSGTLATFRHFYSGGTAVLGFDRANGLTVRCLKD
ncbi:hypothetical protein [Flavobacterium sp.]|uniref:hypothetical protein n=1 Tax=Flavobacterium sp. TaxID=239 RepID=UPI0040472F80